MLCDSPNRVGTTHSALARRLDWYLNTESLKPNDSTKDHESCKQVHDVGEILSVERLLQSPLLVGPGEEKMEESNDSTLEFRATSSIDSCWRECLPDDRLANVCCNEQRDTAS